ncbi:hypothetical protein BLA24_06395 [Streptomyces cinnamoneus]|uniref:Polyamine aminopropyltransferase n=1 Tax=Streptomyces cinnamoneus TaxID=53446 RepID=A0A2G1XMZ9_STRCJ|nr:hypothetical protein BLA24_06395 [Streptomyces cinnamoneus]
MTVRALWLLVAVNALVLALLGVCSALTGPFERAARQAVYGAEVKVAVHSDVQEVVLTGGGASGQPLSLFLDGRLRVSGNDDCRYHEALVHPAMAGPHRRVLVLGGGDGLAVREVLRYPDVASVTVVEEDAAVLRLARADRDLVALNGAAYRDPRVRVVTADAFDWLRSSRGQEAGPYDVVVSDLPDPGVTPSAKLYSQEFYGLVTRSLAPGGRLAIHGGDLSARPHTFWTVDATVRSVGLATEPYRVMAPPARDTRRQDWGLLLASRSPAPLRLPEARPALRTLTPHRLRRLAWAAERGRQPSPPPSTLMHPRYGEP